MHLHPLRISIKFLHLAFYETLCCNRQLPKFKVTHICVARKERQVYALLKYTSSPFWEKKMVTQVKQNERSKF